MPKINAQNNAQDNAHNFLKPLCYRALWTLLTLQFVGYSWENGCNYSGFQISEVQGVQGAVLPAWGFHPHTPYLTHAGTAIRVL